MIRLYIIIFLMANALGVLAGYLIALRVLNRNLNGYLHIVHQDDEQPYIFLELKTNEEMEKIIKTKYAELEVIRD